MVALLINSTRTAAIVQEKFKAVIIFLVSIVDLNAVQIQLMWRILIPLPDAFITKAVSVRV